MRSPSTSTTASRRTWPCPSTSLPKRTALAWAKDAVAARNARIRSGPTRRISALVVRRGSVDRRDLATHGAQVGGELSAVVDGVEEEVPHRLAARRGLHELAAVVHAAVLLPPRVV